MRTVTTVMKSFALLALIATLGVSATASVSQAQRGSVERCSLSGINPADHPNIFSNPAVARSYGFVQSADGTWHVARGCRRGSRARTAAAASASASAPKAAAAPAKADAIANEGKCWLNTGGTSFRWDNCK
jgi:hypothetical protein